MRIAFLSGGKDSYYAVYRYGGRVDLGLMLVLDFPRPSPHTVNLGKSIETLLLSGIPVLTVKLTKGREFAETADVLRMLGADTIIAGDVYIEGHLEYMEKLAREVGATLVEPLWGYDPAELFFKELEDGVKFVVVGCLDVLAKWLGVELSLDNAKAFVDELVKPGLDPLGKRGEYHTIVVNGPLHRYALTYRVVDVLSVGGYSIARLV